MSTAFLKRLRRLPGDERAAAAVEFAMLAPPLIFLILASLQLSIIFYAGQVLQSTATAAGRQLMTGQIQTATAAANDTPAESQAAFQSAVCNNVSFLLTCGNVMIDVESAPTYSALPVATLTPAATLNSNGQPTNMTYSPGGPGDIVILRLMYNWPVVAGPLLPGLANESNGERLLVATSVFKNEPF